MVNEKDKIKLATIIEHFPDPKLQGYLSKLATEQNLINDDSDEPIKHPLIEEIFTGKKGSGYFRPSN